MTAISSSLKCRAARLTFSFDASKGAIIDAQFVARAAARKAASDHYLPSFAHAREASVIGLAKPLPFAMVAAGLRSGFRLDDMLEGRFVDDDFIEQR